MRWRLAWPAALALVLAGPTLAEAAADREVDPWRAALAQLQREDRMLQSLGWKLVTGNAPFCADTLPSIGLLLQDMGGYGQPDQLRRAAGIEGNIAVQAVAAGSPAEQAGLTANAEILAIGETSTADLGPGKGWERLARWHDLLEADLAQDGVASIRWRAGGEQFSLAIGGTPACRSRFELLDEGKGASADGRRVLFGRDFAGFGYPEDEMAAAVAHELAHNLLGHRAWLAEAGRKRRNVRLSEREADRLMPWLLANAGYDPAAASRFMQRFGPRGLRGLFHDGTHDGWDERVGFIEAEVPLVRALIAREGQADWARHFRRDLPVAHD